MLIAVPVIITEVAKILMRLRDHLRCTLIRFKWLTILLLLLLLYFCFTSLMYIPGITPGQLGQVAEGLPN